MVALAGEDGNQNFAEAAAVTLPPTDVPYQEVEVISCRAAEGEAEYDHCRTAGAVEICDGRKTEVNAAVTSAAGNRYSRIYRQKRTQQDVKVVEDAAASAVATTAGRPEAVDVD